MRTTLLERVERVRRERVRAVLDRPIISIGNLRIGTLDIPVHLRAALIARVFSDETCRGCGHRRSTDGVFRHRVGCKITDQALLRLCRRLGVPAVLVGGRA